MLYTNNLIFCLDQTFLWNFNYLLCCSMITSGKSAWFIQGLSERIPIDESYCGNAWKFSSLISDDAFIYGNSWDSDADIGQMLNEGVADSRLRIQRTPDLHNW
jgi:hypothetical protein